ncbi:MAG TPA: NYN domain-containing protein [Methanocorpusculum sp.]|nr:NYN domain-containing protein [Methanocorpusculum sp.]
MNAKRVGLFIDGGYIDHMTKHGFMGKLDFRKFVPFAVLKEGSLEIGYYYTCMPYMSPKPSSSERLLYAKQQKLVSHISKLPNFQVRLGKLQKHGERVIQKRVDVLFALDLAKAAWKNEIDTAILFAGDSDFIPAIEEANCYGVKTILYYYNPSFNRDLLKCVTESCEITPEIYTQLSRKK